MTPEGDGPAGMMEAPSVELIDDPLIFFDAFHDDPFSLCFVPGRLLSVGCYSRPRAVERGHRREDRECMRGRCCPGRQSPRGGSTRMVFFRREREVPGGRIPCTQSSSTTVRCHGPCAHYTMLAAVLHGRERERRKPKTRSGDLGSKHVRTGKKATSCLG